MDNNLLEIKDLHVNAGEKEILKGIDLNIKKGEIHVIMGPNGSGKTTTANAILNNPEYTKTEGTITFDGEDITKTRTDEIARKGIFMSFQLPEEITGVSVTNFLKYAKNKITGQPVKIFQFKDELKKYMEELKKYISKNLYDEKTKTLLRNLNDQKTDISILGAVEPFKLFSADEKKINNTIEKINLTLRTYTGGYLRFEQDHYMEGQNPWPIATLWMAMYYNQKGEKEKAEECIKFVVNSCNEHGLLAEQVDNKTMTSNWVIGLGWSHAMFVLSQKEISQK